MPRKLIFCKSYVEDTIDRRKKYEEGLLFNNSHTKIKGTIEINPRKFSDNEIIILSKENKTK